jgi:hypothetical protein
MVLSAWTEELRPAVLEHGHITFTVHPEVIGRAHRLRMLECFIKVALRDADVCLAGHSMVALVATASLGR